ncbi:MULTISPECIES: hypothetical protein [unclassified Shewanella]|uniref:hypothetical protein n=1 Tax=unclassified Shewanella TaxID=196818 RepID=UPI00005E1A64|nr:MULTISPECIES: hypothetical protein [unclassified Shewanella]ABK48581.1 hypothetical protein Shewana3_2352 [Shewanella sp. ANA-3]
MTQIILKLQKKHQVNLHPAARKAFDVMQSLPGLCNLHALPAIIRSEFASQTIYCLEYIDSKASSNKAKYYTRTFQFYSPIWAALFWENGRPPEGTLLVLETNTQGQLTPESVEKKAWLSLLQVLCLSINSKYVAAFIDDWRQGLPEQFSRELFGKDTLPDQLFCDLLSISRGTLVQQRQRQFPKCPISDSVDILAELAMPWEPK